VRVKIEPVRHLEPLHIEQRGALSRIEGEVLLSKLPHHIAEREAIVLANMLDLENEAIARRIVNNSPGPGNVVTVSAISEHVTEVFVGFGRRGVPAEEVARGVARSIRDYLATGAPIGTYLADQLLLPLALGGSGSYVTLPLSQHALTNIRVIQEFLPLDIRCTVTTDENWRIEIAEPL